MWHYAVNAVLHEVRGERQGRVPWRDGASRMALRKQYIALYRSYLERKHLLEGAGASSSAAAVSQPAFCLRPQMLPLLPLLPLLLLVVLLMVCSFMSLPWANSLLPPAPLSSAAASMQLCPGSVV